MTPKPGEGKIALITGANKGIGLEIARQLGTQGITVLIGARDENRGREAAEKLQAEQIDARVIQPQCAWRRCQPTGQRVVFSTKTASCHGRARGAWTSD